MDLFIELTRRNPYALSTILSRIPLPWQQGFNTVSEVYSISAVSAFNGYPVTTLQSPGTIILSYYPGRLNKRSVKSLRIGYYDTKTKRWKVLPKNTVYDAQNHIIANTTSLMTYFAVLYPR